MCKEHRISGLARRKVRDDLLIDGEASRIAGARTSMTLIPSMLKSHPVYGQFTWNGALVDGLFMSPGGLRQEKLPVTTSLPCFYHSSPMGPIQMNQPFSEGIVRQKVTVSEICLLSSI